MRFARTIEARIPHTALHQKRLAAITPCGVSRLPKWNGDGVVIA
jgi:hypothetical protein